MGLLYKDGIGIEKNKEEAIKLFKLAASQGDDLSLKELASEGVIFDQQILVENQSKKKSFENKKNLDIEPTQEKIRTTELSKAIEKIKSLETKFLIWKNN